MKTNVSSTSLNAYHSLGVADYLQPKERLVMAVFTGPDVKLTRKQIAQRTGLELSCICGRVNSLVAKGALVEDGTQKDPKTNKEQALLKRAEKAPLFEGAQTHLAA